MHHENSDVNALVEWGQNNHSTLDSRIEIYEDPITGLSFRAKNDIPSETCLVKCSHQTTLSFLNAIEASINFSRHRSETFPAAFIDALSQNDPNIIGNFFLIQQYFLREESFWWHYIKLLPQPDQPDLLGIPLWWPDADRSFLDGTNAEPSSKTRQGLWEIEWQQGISLLRQDSRSWERYTYKLYQWAATIYGSRSFRPSLTLINELKDNLNPLIDADLVREHAQKDRFSALLPILDIGNHNGVNSVNWVPAPESFCLSSRNEIAKGDQVYNYYGDKSNSELLVGYGFILDDIGVERVNIKITPPAAVLDLRRSQSCHRPQPDLPEHEFMFYIQIESQPRRDEVQHLPNLAQMSPRRPDSGVLSCFSHGLLDTTLCLVVNARERAYMLENPQLCPEKDAELFTGPLARCAYHALFVLRSKVKQEMDRVTSLKPRKAPQNRNQELATSYRNCQIEVIQSVLSSLSCCLDIESNQLLCPEQAFGWLREHYPDLCLKVETVISEDQEEQLPLDWPVLVQDWDHTYWVVWIYVVHSLQAADSTSFRSNHPQLSRWVEFTQNTSLQSNDHLYAESSELDTINDTIDSIASLFAHTPLYSRELRNFASFVAGEEAIRVPHSWHGGAEVVQDLLFVFANP